MLPLKTKKKLLTLKKPVPKMVQQELTALNDMLTRLINKNNEKISLTDKLGEVQKVINSLRLTEIPEFAGSIGQHGIQGQKMGDGNEWEIKEDMKCGIPDYQMSAAVDYIKKLDNESIIKTKITLDFDGKDVEGLNKLKALLLENEYIFSEKQTINDKTLKKWLQELRQKGTEDLNHKMFGIYDFKEVVIKGVKLK